LSIRGYKRADDAHGFEQAPDRPSASCMLLSFDQRDWGIDTLRVIRDGVNDKGDAQPAARKLSREKGHLPLCASRSPYRTEQVCRRRRIDGDVVPRHSSSSANSAGSTAHYATRDRLDLRQLPAHDLVTDRP
jgi:hypothetical protein